MANARPDLDALQALLDKATPGHHPLSTAESAAHHMANAKDEIVRALPALLAYVRELESLVERMARSDSNVAIAMRERCAQACEEAAQTRLSEGHDAPTMAAVCAAAIRQCAEGLR